MPKKIKILWVVCTLVTFFGFIVMAYQERIQEVRKKQDAEIKRVNEEFNRNIKDKKKGQFPEIPPTDPLKEIKELNAMGKYGEAVNLAEKTARLNPDNAMIHTWWGISLVKHGQKKAAIEKFIIASQLNDRNPRVFLYWGLTLAMQGQFAEALEKYKEATELDPENSNTFAYWGAALIHLNQYEEAVGKLEQSLELNKFNETAHGLLVDALYQLNEYGRAWDIVGRAGRAGVAISDTSLQRLSSAMPEPTKVN